eukprot:gene12852-17227_t
MNIPGDFVRRATANIGATVSSVSTTAANLSSTVSSTVSSVASAVPRRRRTQSSGSYLGQEDFILAGAKEKVAMTIKCTPNKDAVTCSALSIKEGFMMKRNEQGVWHKKFLCTVPHVFLYYFDSDNADAPRGVIDLELYNSFSIEGNILKISGGNEESIRSFYFEDEDRRYLEEWSTSLLRDRYHVVYEERDAYQQMQLEMSGIIDAASEQKKILQQQNEITEKELQNTKKAYNDAFTAMQEMLVVVGITEEEMTKLSDFKKLSHALNAGILTLKSKLEKEIVEREEEKETEKKLYEQFVAKIENDIEAEKALRRSLESSLTKEKKDNEVKIMEFNSQLDNANLTIQMIAAEKSVVESKNNTLNDQKKLLVKEVKQLRKKIEVTQQEFDEMKSLNEKLVQAAAELQQHVTQLTNDAIASEAAYTALLASSTSSNMKLNQASSPSSSDEISSQTSVATTTEEDGPILLQQPPQVLQNHNHHISDATAAVKSLDLLITHCHGKLGNVNEISSVTIPDQHSSHSANHQLSSTSNNANQNGSSISNFLSFAFRDSSHSHTASNSITEQEVPYHVFEGSGGVGEDYDDRVSWEVPPSSLKELSWLSPEQSKLVENRARSSTSSSLASGIATDEHLKTNSSLFGGAIKILGVSTVPNPTSITITDNDIISVNTSAPSPAPTQTLRRISSLFGKDLTTSTISTLSSHPHSSGAALLSEDLMGLSDNNGQVIVENSNLSILASAEDGKSKPPLISNTPKRSSFFSSAFGTSSPEIKDDKDRLPAAMRMKCLRCDGTVEGPRYSTCRCPTPALNPESLASEKESVGMLGGLFSSAGGFTSGIGAAMKVTTQGVSSVGGMIMSVPVSGRASPSNRPKSFFIDSSGNSAETESNTSIVSKQVEVVTPNNDAALLSLSTSDESGHSAHCITGGLGDDDQLLIRL